MTREEPHTVAFPTMTEKQPPVMKPLRKTRQSFRQAGIFPNGITPNPPPNNRTVSRVDEKIYMA
jgi:hypothetical protein